MGKLIRLGGNSAVHDWNFGDDSLCAGGDFICEAVHPKKAEKIELK